MFSQRILACTLLGSAGVAASAAGAHAQALPTPYDLVSGLDLECYRTPGPALNINLKSIPSGTVDGSLNGSFMMSGGLSGQVSLNLTFAGQIEPGADGGVQRKAGTTHITGTATSPAGTYNVDVTR